MSPHSQLSMTSVSEHGVEHEHQVRLYNLGPLLEYGVEHGLEHTQDLDVPCSSLSTKPYSESLVTYVEH